MVKWTAVGLLMADTLPGLDPATADAIARLGVTGLLVLIVVGFLRRIVVTKGEMDAGAAQADARLAEMREQRDGWRKIAEGALEKLRDMTEAQRAANTVNQNLLAEISALRGVIDGLRQALARIERLLPRVRARKTAAT